MFNIYMPSEEYIQGREAAEAGQDVSQNPYPKDSFEFQEWNAGWEMAKQPITSEPYPIKQAKWEPPYE